MIKSLPLLVLLVPLYVMSADAAVDSPVPVASFFDGDVYDALGNAHSVSTVVIDGYTYALVTGNGDAGVQIVNITDPGSPTPAASFFDGDEVGGRTYDALDGAFDVATITIDGYTYALVTGNYDAGVQIVNITDPGSPTPVASFFGARAGGDYLFIASPQGIATMTIDGAAYAIIAEAFHDNVRIVNITEPGSPEDVATIRNTPALALNNAGSIATVTIDGAAYALVTGYLDDGVSIINITDPGFPVPVTSFRDGDEVGDRTYDALDGARDVATVTIDGYTYAVIASDRDDGVQIVNITEPGSPVPAASFFDGDAVGDRTYFKLNGARSVAVVSVDGAAYALVTGSVDDGLQIVNITDPGSPVPVTSFRDGDEVGDRTYDALDGARDVATVTIDGYTYAVIASSKDSGVQIVGLNLPDAMSETTPPTFSVDGRTADYTTDLDLGDDYAPGTIGDIDDASWTDGGQIAGADTVDTGTFETYLVNYTVTDNASPPNSRTITETVRVLPDSDPPVVSSATYTTGNGTLTVTFSEALDPEFTVYAGLHVRDADQISGGVTLGSGTTSGDAVSATLSPAQMESVAGMESPSLDIDAGAVRDTSENPVAAAQDVELVEIDTKAPETTDVTTHDRRTIVMTMSENVTAGGDSGFTVDGVASAPAVTSVSAIGRTVTLGLDRDMLDSDFQRLIYDDGARSIVDLNGQYLASFNKAVRNTLGTQMVLNLAPAGNIDDGGGTFRELEGATGITTFQIGAHTYAAVASLSDDGVQILNVTDPNNITATDQIDDDGDDDWELDGAYGITTFQTGGHTYAAVAAVIDNGVQILNVTDPDNITATDQIDDSGNLRLARAFGITTFQIGAHTYAAVTSFAEHSVQILNVTDPSNIAATDAISDIDLDLRGAAGITTFQTGGHTYAAVASSADHNVRILNVTDPSGITAMDQISDGGAAFRELEGATGITTFQIGAHTYAAVAGQVRRRRPDTQRHRPKRHHRHGPNQRRRRRRLGT